MLFVLENGEKRAVKEQEEKSALLAHTIESSVTRSFQDVISRLERIENTLWEHPDYLDKDTSTLQRHLKALLPVAPSLREIVVHNSAGQWVTSSKGRQPQNAGLAAYCSKRLLTLNTRNFIILAEQSGRFLGSNPSASNHLSHIPLCLRVRDDVGNTSAILTAAINPDYIKELFRPAEENNPVTVELYTYTGIPLVRHPLSSFTTGSHAHEALFQHRLLRNAFATYYQKEPTTQIEYITSYRSTSSLPLVLVVQLDLQQGLASWHKESNIILSIFSALIITVTFGGLLLILLLIRKDRMEEELLLLQTAIRSTANAIFITNCKGKIQWVNKAFERLTGWSLSEVKGKTPRILNSGTHTQAFYQQLWSYILEGKVWRGQVTNVTKEKHTLIIDQTITPIVNEYGEVTHFIAVHEDVTARTHAEQQARYLSRHDPLTGLPNRRAFNEWLDGMLTGEQHCSCAVIFIDLDKFKTINDTLGHQAGDTVLEITAQRMTALMNNNSVLARLGGDEFAIAINQVEDSKQLVSLAEKILLETEKPITLDNNDYAISASIGITLGHSQQNNASTLLRQADLAMYKAKHDGRNTFCFYDDQLDYSMHRQMELEQGIRTALLSNNQLELYYQPVVSAVDLTPVSVEALMRWHHGKNGDVPPSEFIPVAEDSGAIIDLGRWSLHQVCDTLQTWQQNPVMQRLKLSLNVSAVQLTRDNIAEILVSKLRENNLTSDQLTVEVTETALMTQSSQLKENLAFFKQNSIDLSIDDFGTGFSSLLYLSELDANVIKIDQSFVSGIGYNHSYEEIILATIALARNLEMKVIAEGVETTQQLKFLQDSKVDYLQGYLLAKPMPESSLLEYMQSFYHPQRADK